MKITETNFKGMLIMIAAQMFAITQTRFFGFNYYPESLAEAICDVVSLVVCFYGLWLWFKRK